MKALMRILLCLCLYLCLALPFVAQALTLENAPVITLDKGQFSVLRDPSKVLTLDDVRTAQAQGRFQALSGNLGIGYVPDAVWLHVSFERLPAQPAQWWLEVLPAYLDDIRLFHIRPNGDVDIRQSGDRYPQSVKEESYRGSVFKLEFQPGQHEIYLRLQTTSTVAVIAKLWQPAEFAQYVRNSYLVYGAYFSLILAVLIFNFANWVVSRRPIFMVYVAFLSLNIVKWLSIYGFLPQYAFPEQPLLANLVLGLSLSLDFAVSCVFFVMLLELRLYHPRFYRIHQAAIVLALITAVATPLGHYQTFAPWLMFTAILLIALIPFVAIRLWRTGETANRLISVAILSYGLLIGMQILATLAVLPFRETINNLGLLSNLGHIMLLHLGMMMHYRHVERDHAIAVEKSLLAERQLQLEKAHSEEQDKLLAMITHEIRTPIAVIDAATQTLEALDKVPNADREERYERIHRSVNRLSVLLDLTVAQTHRTIDPVALMKSVIDPLKLTRDVVQLLGNPLAQRIHISAEGPLPALIGDDRLLRFALLNLLDNACKYSPPDSPVGVRIETDAANVSWYVEDEGPGIPSGMEERIFEKYIRASEVGSKAGLGLGLYLARHIVKLHGGTLTATVGRTQGACFACRLPITPKEDLH